MSQTAFGLVLLVLAGAMNGSFTLPMKELKDWRGNRSDAGRIAPKGFPKNNKFRNLPAGGKGGEGD